MNLDSSGVPPVTAAHRGELASRTQRLAAAFIDGTLAFLITGPTMYLTGGFDGILEGGSPSTSYTLAIALVGILVFVALHGKLLLASGQTIGKRLLHIKIVDSNGDLPSAQEHLFTRYAVYLIAPSVPMLGGLLSLINLLTIFGPQRRCIHDLIAATHVVRC